MVGVERECPEITMDSTLSVLSHPYRRYIHHYLSERSNVELLEIAQNISREHGEEVETVRIELYHSHLPRLREYAILEGDKEIEKGENFTLTFEALRRLESVLSD